MNHIVPSQPISYKQFIVIIAAQFVVLLPHIAHLPPLFSGLGFLTLIGLTFMAKRRKNIGFNPQPPRFLFVFK